MIEHEIHVRLSITRHGMRWGIVGLLLLFTYQQLGSETLTMTTTYPSPSGIYNTMVTTGQTTLGRSATSQVSIVPNGGTVSIGGKVGIGTASPQAALDITSTTSGFLPPRMPSGSLPTPVPAGSVAYATDKQLLYLNNGSAWQPSGGSGFTSCTIATKTGFGTPATATCPAGYTLTGGGCDGSYSKGGLCYVES